MKNEDRDMLPEISVIMGIYNCELTLEEAVDKYVVLKQTVELNNGEITGYGKEVIRY